MILQQLYACGTLILLNMVLLNNHNMVLLDSHPRYHL